MNRSRLLLIGTIALALGAVVAMLVYRRLESGGGSETRAGVEAFVAADDLDVGSKIEERDIKLLRFPAADLPANYQSQKSKVIGRGVVLPIVKGEFILPSKLAGENAGAGLPALIPPGMRAVSVRVNDTTAVSGFVLPGTRVDVLLTGTPQNGAEQETTTVLENVAVLATGQKLERNASGEPQSAPVITLLVSPEDAQKLTLATTQGHIQLALRNPLDTKQQDLASARSGSLYKIAPAAPRPVHVSPRVTVAAPPAIPPAYTVEVYRGDKKDETKF
jgi:pilus assembly protein CpaB